MNPDILSNFPLYFIVFTDRHRIYARQIWHHSFDMKNLEKVSLLTYSRKTYINMLYDIGCIYRTPTIISRVLYILFSIFLCSLYCRAVNITDNFGTKQGNSSILEPKICGL